MQCSEISLQKLINFSQNKPEFVIIIEKDMSQTDQAGPSSWWNLPYSAVWYLITKDSKYILITSAKGKKILINYE